MSDKMGCPGCGSHSSSILAAYEEGGPCPYCGLSAEAITQVIKARENHANEELIEKYTEAVARAELAERKVGFLEGKLERIGLLVKEKPYNEKTYRGPW